MKITLMRLILVFVALLVLLVVVQLRQTPVILDKTTTYITEPLKDNGLPDYSKFLDDARKEGIRREDNAAIDFWRAIGPNTNDVSEFEAICRELEIEFLPTTFLKFIESKETVQWVNDFVQSTYGDREYLVFGTAPERLPKTSAISASGTFGSDAWAENLIQQARRWPWGSEDLPLKDWVEDNRGPLELLIASSRKPQFYSPPLSHLNNPNEPAYFMSLDAKMLMRYAVYCIATRCMYRIHEGELSAAIDDATAIGRLAKLQRGSFPVERRIEIEFRQLCYECFTRVLASQEITFEQAELCEQRIESFDARITMTDAIDIGERLLILDAVLRTLGPDIDSIELEFNTTFLSLRKTVNKNRVLQTVNQWYDELVEISRTEDATLRSQATTRLDSKLTQAMPSDSLEMSKKLATKRGRSEYVAHYLLSTLIGGSTYALTAPDDDATRRIVLLVTAALVKHRLKNGSYPETLDNLKTEVECVDVFGEPLVYRLKSDGFLLYALGANRKDDNGSQSHFPQWRIESGEWKNDFLNRNPDQSDDIVVRFPEPAMNWHEAVEAD